MMSDSSVDSGGGGGNTMSVISNTSIKTMMSQGMCLKGASNANAMNQSMGNSVLNAAMGHNGSNIINNIDMNASMAANARNDMDATDVSSLMTPDQNQLMHQQQHQILRNKAMNMPSVGSRPPPPEYKGHTLMPNQIIQQPTPNQFAKVAPPPPNMRHLGPSGMFYK